MTVEYLVLGVVLICPGDRCRSTSATSPVATTRTQPERRQVPTRRGTSGGRVWQGWTAILGVVGIGLGIAFVVLGALGR